MNLIIYAVIAVTVIGIICAAVLSVASKVMAVEEDERIPLVRECLPGANCGGCGFPGCDGYAAALVEDEELPLTLCAPGGESTALALADVLGRSAGEMMRPLIIRSCNGDCNMTQMKMEYQGINTCVAAKIVFGGTGKCTYGCMGLGDCAEVCPKDAIFFGNGIAHINVDKCINCGACIKACPNGIISMIPADLKIRIACSNKDKGAAVRKICSVGCIGCGLCMKNCPEGAITIKDNLAVIDYDKCIGCGLCKSNCPSNCIIM